MKKFFLNLTLLLLALSLIFISLEIFLRLTHAFGARISHSQPDPVLGWRFIPNQDFLSMEETSQPVKAHINSSGWKDKEWFLKKNPGVYRIAVLGDSYVEALQVPDSKNFLRVSEKNLKAQGLETEWMNFGRSGFTQSEEYLALQSDVLKFQPDLVMVLFFPVNDIDDISPLTAPDATQPFFEISPRNELILNTSFKNSLTYKIKSWIGPLKQHSLLISLITQRYSLLTQSRSLDKIRARQNGSRLQGYLSLATQHPDPQYEKNYLLNKRLIQEMASLCHQKGIPFMLVTLDTPAYLPSRELEYKNIDNTFDPLFFEKDLENLSRVIGFSYFSLQSLFRDEFTKSDRPLHIQYWGFQGRGEYFEYGAHSGHWSEAGHEVVARALSVKVLTEILAKKQPAEISSLSGQKDASKS